MSSMIQEKTAAVNAFVAELAIPFHHRLPDTDHEVFVFWSEDEGELHPIDDSAQIDTIEGAQSPFSASVREALCSFSADDDSLGYIIQFWAPLITTSGRLLLSTYAQPFAVQDLSEELCAYRQLCMGTGYSIYDHNRADDPAAMMISDAPTATAFLKRIPQFVLFEKLRGENFLANAALDYGLTHSFLLPVYQLSQTTTTSCIGVLELSMPGEVCYPGPVFDTIRSGLAGVGLRAFQTENCIPYERMPGLESTKVKIEEALQNVVKLREEESLLAQVWISLEDVNLSVKLGGYADGIEECCNDYYDLCDMFPLEMGEDFVQKTLEDSKPRFCSDVSKLRGAMLAKQVFNDFVKGRLAICLRSNESGDVSYVFEFVWGDSEEPVGNLVEEILILLKCYLPGFKLASGGKLGDELDFIDVGDSSSTQIKYLKIFQRRSVPVRPGEERRIKAPVEPKCKKPRVSLTKEMIEGEIGNTMRIAVENLRVGESTSRRNCSMLGVKCDGVNKREVGDLYHGTNEENKKTVQELLPIKRSLTIKVEYNGDKFKLHQNTSEATFATVEEEIISRLELTLGTFKMKYLDGDGDRMLLTCEDDLNTCFNETAARLQAAYVQLFVETKVATQI